ncbi:MAG: hypothetical protein CL484_14790 [Acidobacteria bacterium]|nr:hypothetical protein [Acidobacteriota bacterium]
MFILVPVAFDVAPANVLFLLVRATVCFDHRLIDIGAVTPRWVARKIEPFEGRVHGTTNIFAHTSKIRFDITIVRIKTLLHETHVVRKTPLVGTSSRLLPRRMRWVPCHGGRTPKATTYLVGILPVHCRTLTGTAGKRAITYTRPVLGIVALVLRRGQHTYVFRSFTSDATRWFDPFHPLGPRIVHL